MMTKTPVVRRPRALPGLAAALLVFAAAATARAQEDPTGSWASKASAQTFAQGGYATDGTYLYIAGGMQDSAFNELHRYDPATDTWETLAPIEIGGTPIGLFDNAAAISGGTLYTLGGFDMGTSAVSDLILAYDIATDTWSDSGARLGSARMRLAATTHGGLVYMAGGLDASFGQSAACEVFDPSTLAVDSIDDLPTALSLSSMAVAANRIFLAGGFDMGGPVASFYEFDLASGQWLELPSIQDGAGNLQYRYAPAAFGLLDRFYVTGGFLEAQEAGTFEYNPADNTWARRADLNTARYNHAAAAINGFGYVAGGSSVDSVEEFTSPHVGPPPNTPPTANAGADRTEEATSTNGASVTLDGSGSDADGDALTYSWTGPFGQASGATPTVCLALGSHELTLTVSDGTDTATDTVTITVVDTTAPAIVDLSASPPSIHSNNKKMKPVTISATVEDAADAAPVTEIIGVTSSQPAGDEPDWEITGALTVMLRAERSNGLKRTYTITVRSTDASGNSSTDTVNVCVEGRDDGDPDGLEDAGDSHECNGKGKKNGHHKHGKCD